MLDENSSREPQVTPSYLKIALVVEGFQTVSHELLELLTELTQTESHLTYREYLALINSTLLSITDLETQVAIARAGLESERLIQNIRNVLFK